MGYSTRITWLVVSIVSRVSPATLISNTFGDGNCCHYAILWVVRLENGDKYKMTWRIFLGLNKLR